MNASHACGWLNPGVHSSVTICTEPISRMTPGNSLIALVVIVKALPSKPATRNVETDLTHCGWMRGN